MAVVLLTFTVGILTLYLPECGFNKLLKRHISLKRTSIIYSLRDKLLSLPTLRLQHVKPLFVGLYSNLNVFPVDLRGGKGFIARAEGKEV